MLNFKNISGIHFLILLYFLNLVLYSLSFFYKITLLETICWFIRIPLLLIIYLLTGSKNKVYFLALLFYQTASILFFTNNLDLFYVGSLASVLYKLSIFLILIPLINKENRIAISIACLPFFITYLFLIELVMHSLGDTMFIWILNAFITSFIGGIAIIHNNNFHDTKGFWLLISSILFIIQIGAFFINKFYLRSEAIYQIVIFSYGISHFTFYKFLILKEQEKSPT